MPEDTETIKSLVKLIDLSIYPESSDIENPNDQWFVFLEKEEIIGTVAARTGRGEIRHLAVLPIHRRKGIGSQLVRYAMEFLKSRGHSRVWAQVRVDKEESQRLFEKLGFRKESKPITSIKNPKVKLYKYVLML